MKTILLTGDSKGLGLSILRVILQDTDVCVIGLSRNVNEEIIELNKKFTNRYIHYNFNLDKPEEIKEFYLKTLKKHGPFYAFINNAAMAYDDIITNMNIEPLEQMFKVNVYSPMMLTKYMLRDMLLHNIKGTIIHISSISVHTGYKGLSMYAATKGALEAFSKNTAREWGAKGICSNAIVAGFMETEMSSTLSNDQKNRIYNRTSLKKPTNPKDVAFFIRHLLSGDTGSITGQNIFIDSGTI